MIHALVTDVHNFSTLTTTFTSCSYLISIFVITCLFIFIATAVFIFILTFLFRFIVVSLVIFLLSFLIVYLFFFFFFFFFIVASLFAGTLRWPPGRRSPPPGLYALSPPCVLWVFLLRGHPHDVTYTTVYGLYGATCR
jgi:hypothetical protein